MLYIAYIMHNNSVHCLFPCYLYRLHGKVWSVEVVHFWNVWVEIQIC